MNIEIPEIELIDYIKKNFSVRFNTKYGAKVNTLIKEYIENHLRLYLNKIGEKEFKELIVEAISSNLRVHNVKSLTFLKEVLMKGDKNDRKNK